MYRHQRRNRRIILLLAFLSLLRLLYIGWKEVSQEAKPYRIVVTTSIIADSVREIVGDRAEVFVLIQPSIDPHSYHTSSQDIRMVESADLVFKHGLHFEGALDRDLDKLKEGYPEKVYSLHDALDSQEDIRYTDGHPDCHVYFDVMLWIKQNYYMGAIIKRCRPDHAAFFQHNIEAYIERLAALEEEVKTTLASIPAERRFIVMPHNSFGYLQRYGVKVASPQGLSAISEPSLQTRHTIGAEIKALGVHAIFLETTTHNKSIYAIQEDCQRSGYPMDCYMLYTDSLSKEGETATYIGMYRYNIETIKEALS